MGGPIALTIRFDVGDEYRGSCWTNVLPEGLFDAPFYDPDKSKAHAKAWLKKLLARRSKSKDLEEMWGGHDMLAPLGYGLVVVDYVTSTLVSGQGYTSPNKAFYFGNEMPDKWRKLDKKGLLVNQVHLIKDMHYADIVMPFKDVRRGDWDMLDEALMDETDKMLGLSLKEREAWREFIEERKP